MKQLQTGIKTIIYEEYEWPGVPSLIYCLLPDQKKIPSGEFPKHLIEERTIKHH